MYKVLALDAVSLLATLHGEQHPMCAGGLQGGPPRGEAVPRDDSGRVLLQAQAPSPHALLQHAPQLHQQEHLHPAGLGRNVPVGSQWMESDLEG